MSKTKPFIKICGITREQDLLCALDNGADAIGFIAFKKSPRYITPEGVKALIDLIPENIRKVVVVVNASIEEINEYLLAGIDTVQLHGNETAEFAKQVQAEVWRAVRLHKAEQISDFADFPCEKFVVDSFQKDAVVPGGTGHKADWDLARKFNETIQVPMLLAGGITAENANEALAEVGCHGLDLSSGVEIEPGIKSATKIKEFFGVLG